MSWSATIFSGNRLILLLFARESNAFKHLQVTDVLELGWFCSSKGTENLVSLLAQALAATDLYETVN